MPARERNHLAENGRFWGGIGAIVAGVIILWFSYWSAAGGFSFDWTVWNILGMVSGGILFVGGIALLTA